MGKRNNNRLAERVWAFLVNHNDAMTTSTIYQHYKTVYGNEALPKQQTMTQILLYSRLFKRVGWYNESSGETYATTGSIKDLNAKTGVPSTNLVCIIEARTIEEISAPYLDPSRSPIRRLDRMPKFVREYVKEASQ